MADVEDLERLAEACLATAKVVKNYLSANGHPQPTFDQNGPAHFPVMSSEADLARAQLRNAAKTLYDLTSGPDEPVGPYAYYIVSVVSSVYAWRMAQHGLTATKRSTISMHFVISFDTRLRRHYRSANWSLIRTSPSRRGRTRDN